MLRLNSSGSLLAFWKLFTSQVVIYGGPALALGGVCYVLTGMKSIETLIGPPLFVMVIAGGISLFIWVVGMASDLFFLVIKTGIWCIAYVVSLAVNPALRWWRRGSGSRFIGIPASQTQGQSAADSKAVGRSLARSPGRRKIDEFPASGN